MGYAKTDSSENADREIVTQRLVSAPRELVWEVWTNPKHVAIWWGPNGFTNTIHEMDVKPGGVWRFMMHGPDGVDYPNKIVFVEVVQPEKLTYWHDGDDDNTEQRFFVTTTFEDQGGKTLVTMRALLNSAEECERVKKFGAVEGGQQTLAKLDAYLAKM